MIMAVEFCVERKEPRKVATLRIDRRGRLPGDLGYEVRWSERPEAVLAPEISFGTLCC
jgi:hypothetical protein